MASNGTGFNSEDLADLNEVTNIDELLNSLGLDLMKDNIQKQIRNETTSTTDFLSVIVDKFKNMLEEESIEEEDKSEIKVQIIDFCEELIQLISEEYGIAINMISDDYQNMISIMTTLYNFLILNRYHNVEKFLIAYIEENKKPLAQSIGADDRVKDITSIANRKKNFDKDDVAVLSHISEIIDFIKNSNTIESDEFLSIVDDGELYTSQMVNYYSDGTLVGNFVPSILCVVLGEEYDSNEATRIRNSIRTAFYTKSPITLVEGEV